MAILSYILDKVTEDPEVCQKVVETNSNKNSQATLCGNKKYRQGVKNGLQYNYCKEHVPSEAIIAGGRTEPISFYIPEEDEIIEVK